MKHLRDSGQSKFNSLLEVVRGYQLFIACVVIVLCFAIGNDLYRAQSIALKNRDLMPGRRRVVNFEDAARAQSIRTTYHSDLRNRYLIDPKASKQRSMLSAFAGSDLCGPTGVRVPSLPYTDISTTVGLGDDYDISGDPTACPAPTCSAYGGTFQFLPDGSQDRGIAYTGTGTGLDAAYRIRFKYAANLFITLDPTDPAPNGDDLALIFYTDTCSNDPATAIVLADNAGDGNSPDLPDNSETITITSIPPGNYNIVVDGYTSGGAPSANPTAGPYRLDVACVAGMTCVQPSYPISRVPRS